MDKSFWHQRWEQGDIAFHESQVNPALVDHLSLLNLAKGARIFLPLCGKTLDIAWLLNQGYRVAGAELSPLAVNDLFDELGLAPTKTQAGSLTLCSAPNIDIWIGDIFDLSSNLLGPVDAVYDRAALVALPEHTRRLYTAHLATLSHKAQQLLLTYEYDQSVFDGPPFSIPKRELVQHYGKTYQIEHLSKTDVAGGLKGQVTAALNIWHLQERNP